MRTHSQTREKHWFFAGFVFSLRPVFASFARLRGYWWGYW
jgi:hypothetical protein